MLYESMLLFGLAFAVGLAFSILTQMRSGMDAHRPWLLASVVLTFGIYFTYCWGKGQTLAMRTWKIRVVDRRGVAPHPLRALFRYACCWLWVLPPMAFVAPLKLSAWQMGAAIFGWMTIWALLSWMRPNRQFLHDTLAGTRLVPA